MQSFSQHLVELVLADLVEEDVASNAASNRHDFEIAVQQALRRRRADEKAAAAGRSRGGGSPARGDGACLERKRHRPPGRVDRKMRKAVAAAALLIVLAFAGGRHGAELHDRDQPGPAAFPSSETPNAPGSINVPFPLSVPPGQPAVRSYDELLVALASRRGHVRRAVAGARRRSTRSSRTSGATWARARPARVGWMQFMPDTWLRWGMDANGDGLADPWNPDDAVFAAARYLAAAGAHDDISRAVFAYNHAQWYVDEVLGLAADFGSGGSIDFTGSQAVFRLDELQQQIAEARRDVARAREAVPRIERRVGESTDRQLRLELKAGRPEALDRGVPRAGEHASPTSSARRRATAFRSRPGRPILPRPSPGSSP